MSGQKTYLYKEEPIPSEEHKVPRWLALTYMILPIWGIVAMYIYWNGSVNGWFDRGYWTELQQAANTTFPYVNADEPQQEKEVR